MLATVVASQPYGRATLLTVEFPVPNEAPTVAGRFFLARCNDGSPLDRRWDPYLRRTLRPIAYTLHEGKPQYTLLVPAGDDPGDRWLAQRHLGDSVDLLGPAGNGFTLDARSRALLLVSDQTSAPLLFPLVHHMLDGGGRVTLLVRKESDPEAQTLPLDLLLQNLPLAVEAHAETSTAFAETLANLGAWADCVCIALTSSDPTAYSNLMRSLRAKRLRVDAGFAQALWPDATPCGVGACLACLAPLASGGFTRACTHGPVFDLIRLAA